MAPDVMQYKFIANFLTNIKVNGIVSGFSEVKTGVLQETILSPLLFILHVND